jgi:5,10-methylenetetrahydromethanopterin reductase
MPERHLAIHEGHLVEPNELDRIALAEGAELTTTLTFTGTAEELRRRVCDFADQGVTEIAYQPAGPDIGRELEAFARMARS